MDLDESNFEKETAKGNIVIDFYADWCGPCKAMKPAFEELGKETKNVKFFKVDVDSNQAIASKFGIMSIPAFVFLKDGKETNRVIGAIPKHIFKEKIEESFGK